MLNLPLSLSEVSLGAHRTAQTIATTVSSVVAGPLVCTPLKNIMTIVPIIPRLVMLVPLPSATACPLHSLSCGLFH